MMRDEFPRTDLALPYLPPTAPASVVPANFALPLTAEKAAVIRRVTTRQVIRHLWATPLGIAALIYAGATLTGGGLWDLLRQVAPGLAQLAHTQDTRSTTMLLGQQMGIVSAWVAGILAIFACIVLAKMARAAMRAGHTLRTAQADFRDGTYLIATGPFVAAEHSRGENDAQYWTLTLHDCAFPISRAVFEQLRTVQSGSIAYARYTRCLFEVQDEHGVVRYHTPLA